MTKLDHQAETARSIADLCLLGAILLGEPWVIAAASRCHAISPRGKVNLAPFFDMLPDEAFSERPYGFPE